MTKLLIRTPQNVNLHYKVVNIGERVLAFLIDLVIFSAYLFLVDTFLSALKGVDLWTSFGLQQLLLLPIMFYSLYMHILFQGQTVGKMAMKTRVVKADGTAATWSDYATRWALRLIDIWLFLGSVGFLAIIFSDKSQRIGDYAAGTVVISIKNKIRLDHTLLEEIAQDYYPSFYQVTNLTDKDVRLIKETYLIALRSRDYETMNLLRKKVEAILETSSELYDQDYISRVLKDYNYLTFNM